MKTNKRVMVMAWEIAREGVKKFGGKVSEYFAESLRKAWAIVKEEIFYFGDMKNAFVREINKYNGLAERAAKFNPKFKAIDVDAMLAHLTPENARTSVDKMRTMAAKMTGYVSNLESTVYIKRSAV